MTETYFGGDGSDLGTVTPLPVSTWRDFVNAVLGHPVVIPCSRTRFHEMDRPARDKVKRVRFVTPATFKTNHRITGDATGFALVALDIDDSAHALPLYRDHNMIRDGLHPFGFAVYTTARSTPEAPRLRVFVRVQGILPPELYDRAVNTVATRLGLPTVTKESYVMVQPMYLPSIFRDEDPTLDHPLLVSDTEGRGLLAADLSARNGRHTTSVARGVSEDADTDLDNLRAPVDGVTLDDCRDALNALSPDMKMAEWIEVAAALKHQFNSEEAFQLWDEWSAKGAKYPGEKETAYRWKTLKAHPKGRAPITIRSLLFRATEAGWSGGKVEAKCYETLARWIVAPDRTAAELLGQGADRIAAAPLLSPIEKGALLGGLQTHLKTLGVKVSRSDLQKQLRSAENAAKTPKGDGPTAESELPPWARGISYVTATGEFFLHTKATKLDAQTLDAAYSRYLMTPDSSSTGKPAILPRDFLLNLHRIPVVDYYLYDPSNPQVVRVQKGNHIYINTYVASHPPSDPALAEEAGRIFWTHLVNLCGREDYAGTLADFCAFQVQSPGEKVRWAVLLQGAQGCGKSIIADAMRAVLGETNLRLVNGDMLIGRDYNEWATGSQLVAIEEIRVPTSKREVMEKMKALVTNSTVSINAKYENLKDVPNCSNYLLFTNYRDALALTDDDRRYFVVHSPIQSKAQIHALGSGYFSQLVRLLRELSGGLRSWLEQRRISPDFCPNGHAPETVHRRELIAATASPLMAAVRDAIRDSSNPLIRPDLVSQLLLRRQLELDAPSGMKQATNTGIAAVLREMGYVEHHEPFRHKDEKHVLWQPADRPHGDNVLTAALLSLEDNGL